MQVSSSDLVKLFQIFIELCVCVFTVVDPSIINDCVAFVESLQWESPELKEILLDLAKKQDQQLIAFYKSLKGFPSSFMNVASKYAKYSKTKK